MSFEPIRTKPLVIAAIAAMGLASFLVIAVTLLDRPLYSDSKLREGSLLFIVFMVLVFCSGININSPRFRILSMAGIILSLFGFSYFLLTINNVINPSEDFRWELILITLCIGTAYASLILHIKARNILVEILQLATIILIVLMGLLINISPIEGLQNDFVLSLTESSFMLMISATVATIVFHFILDRD